MKFNITLILVTIISLFLSAFFFYAYRHEQNSRFLAGNNVSVLMKENEMLKKDTAQLRLGILTMTQSEIKKAFPELVKTISNVMDVKLKNIKQITTTQLEINHTFKTTIRDSLRLDTIPFQYMAYTDSFTDFEAQQIEKELYVPRNIEKVPLLQVVFREKWKLKNLFPWHWGNRQLIQDIKSNNPHAVIDFNRVINVEK